MSIGQLRFIDSFQFLSCSLDKLVKNLESDDLRITHGGYPSQEHFERVQHK